MSLLKKAYRTLVDTKWNIGFFEYSGGLDIPKICWLKHDERDSWFADPFILSADNDKIEVLVEEWQDSKGRGRISKLVVDKSTLELKKIIPILSLDTHLSFPAILRVGGDIFVYPENFQSKSSVIYKYDKANERLEKFSTLCAKPLTDAILTYPHFSGRNIMLSTDSSSPSGNVLSVYESEDLFGGYEKVDEIKFSDKSARNAGCLFKCGEKLVRPAQNCDKRYGHGLVFQEISEESGTFRLKELKRVFPDGGEYNLGLHTFNTLGNLAVTDGYRYRTPYLGAMLNAMRIPKILIKARSIFRKLTQRS